MSLVFNNYGMGTDTLGVPGRSRIHTDNSIEIRYFNRPDNFGLDKMAFSVTGDLGCEYGGGVSCHNDSHGHPKQDFAGWMLYNRFWFHKDLFGLTLGAAYWTTPADISAWSHRSMGQPASPERPTFRHIRGAYTRPGIAL